MTSEAGLIAESLHPSIWRAFELARSDARSIDTGHAVLSAQLPGGEWPVGTLIELRTQQPGIGEIRLLGPALARIAKSGIVMLEPPHAPQITALAGLGIAPAELMWIRAGQRTVDALWAAEQVLRSGRYSAVL